MSAYAIKNAQHFTHDCILSSYENVEAIAGEPFSPASWSAMNIHAWLLEQASDVVSGATTINPDVDLFEQGFDR